jgi:alkylhydroperoxidase/carboxymuconolactone decarboxylase family protein YurZ
MDFDNNTNKGAIKMGNEQKPSVEQIFSKMRQGMGNIPTAIEKAAAVDEGILYEHMRSRAYTMPENGVFDEETRTLLYLAAALAASSKACIQAMADKAKMQKIAPEKVLETFRIVRFAMTAKVLGEAEPVFEALQKS